jgi:deoxyribodipyrimidine photolyase
VFLPRAGRDYAEQRNHVSAPEHENVSGLSPWIRCQQIS